MLAGLGAKVFRDYDHAVRTCVVERDSFRPDPRLVTAYRHGFGVYRSLYPALRPIFDQST
jgi:sugar (pentulose or hexulose) kinase